MIFWGASLIVIGVLILLNQAGILDLRFSESLMPALLIVFGIRMLIKRKKGS